MYEYAYKYIKLEVITSSNKIGHNKILILIPTYSVNSSRHCTYNREVLIPPLRLFPQKSPVSPHLGLVATPIFLSLRNVDRLGKHHCSLHTLDALL